MRLIGLLFLAGLMQPAFASDEDAIALTVFDYMDGWYQGDAARMERALHPDLAKRAPMPAANGETRIEHMGALQLVQMTRAGVGRSTPKEAQKKEVVILDIDDDVASVKAIMHAWVDYIHLARLDGQWKIVNVLWDLND